MKCPRILPPQVNNTPDLCNSLKRHTVKKKKAKAHKIHSNIKKRAANVSRFLFLLQNPPPPGPLPAVSEISVSVTGIYLLGTKMNLSGVLSFEAAPGRQVLS